MIKEEKIKVLYFVDRMLRGGIQTFVINYMTNFDRERIQIDYLLLDDGISYELEDKLKELGSKVYKLQGIWVRKPWDYYKYCKSARNFFKTHNDYKVVHLHSSSKNWPVLYYAKKYGISKRIAHSHNIGFQTNSKIQVIMGNIFKLPLKASATHYFACSRLAGKWMFGEKNVKKNKVTVINNAIDTNKFLANAAVRNKKREELKINGELAFGHVGRFTDQKNHSFLIDVFSEINKRNSKTKLLLIGTGPNENEIKEKVNNLNLKKKVIFAGFQTNVEEYMQAMDVFVFPSKFEGLGLVLIEAQAMGLPSFTSDKVVPLEAQVSNLLIYIDLGKSAAEWADIIVHEELNRRNVIDQIIKKGYSIKESAEYLEELYKA